ncbi:MarR family transcriptional regulator [soil metagenome]
MKLSELIKQEHFSSPSQEAVLNVQTTQAYLHSEIAATLESYGITPAQYNVLRILRGKYPETATCSYIGERLLDRTPDVTRLLDRLEKSGLVDRLRSSADRRVMLVSLTDSGRTLLKSLDQPVEDKLQRLTRHLSDGELRQLSNLLERVRQDQV